MSKRLQELEEKMKDKAKEVRGIEQHYWKAMGVLEQIQMEWKAEKEVGKVEKKDKK